jgi:hypothetical protein
MKKKSNGQYRTPIYKSYVFRDKDPAIDILRTLVEDHFKERLSSKNLNKITHGGGPSLGCMQAWFFGKTKRPTNPTLEAAGRALGYERVWRKM